MSEQQGATKPAMTLRDLTSMAMQLGTQHGLDSPVQTPNGGTPVVEYDDLKGAIVIRENGHKSPAR